LSTIWWKVSGPGDVLFGAAQDQDTTATFSAVGTYVLQLHAFDGSASASEDVTITVVRVCDFDDDSDVDQNDGSVLRGCMTGANGGPPGPGCTFTDIDQDLDTDQADFGLLQRCLSGEGIPSDPHCAD
jgi:hypothetical protein